MTNWRGGFIVEVPAEQMRPHPSKSEHTGPRAMVQPL